MSRWNDFISQINFLPATLRKILSTKNCSLFRSFSRRTKPKSELESTTSKYSGPLTKPSAFAEADRDLETLRKELSYKEAQAKLGGDLWNSGQPSFAASVSSQLSLDKLRLRVLQIPGTAGYHFFHRRFRTGDVGTDFLRRVDERND